MAEHLEDDLLFVYGSLKRGQVNHRQLGQARFVADMRTVARFALRLIDGYPALVPGERSIRGELHRLNQEQWAGLDEFEGDGYRRALIELIDGSHAVTYLARQANTGVLLDADEWPM